MVEDIYPLHLDGQNRPFPLLPLAPHGEVAKAPLPKRFLVSVDAVIGIEFLATTLADKHIATVLPNCALVSRSQRLDSLVTYMTGVNPLSLVCFVSQH